MLTMTMSAQQHGEREYQISTITYGKPLGFNVTLVWG